MVAVKKPGGTYWERHTGTAGFQPANELANNPLRAGSPLSQKAGPRILED